ncbi:MAG TPA: MopE-related protein [Labilithrix sp.]|nr:MopE-related protein [Labilithrix sp.]
MMGVGLAVLGACAEGGTVTGELPLQPDATSPDSGAGTGPCADSCSIDETCSDGVCVPVEVDSDSDGVSALTDCDDNDPSIHPGASEVCNEKDDDCNGKIDDGVDKDGDGSFACGGEGPFDCDDNDPAINPGVKAEVCNGKDDDCNGKTDEIPTSLTPTLSDSHWKLLGTASLASGWARLTSDATGQVGALFWNATYTFDSFDVEASFKVGQKTDPADGVAFVWLKGTSLAAGSGGNGFGAGGKVGYAVAIDTYTNNEDDFYAPFLAVVNTTSSHTIKAVALPTTVADGNEHTLRIVLKAGKITVSVDGTEKLKDFHISGYAPFAGYWGFTASTGAFSGTHSVRNVTMKFPDGQGCVP